MLSAPLPETPFRERFYYDGDDEGLSIFYSLGYLNGMLDDYLFLLRAQLARFEHFNKVDGFCGNVLIEPGQA